ncbi:MAG: 4-alpha-glucanotransferase [Chloroflexi bacterium]|nr:4-alpha-glucanotransferase [Chloroflexota bacterium]
MTLFPRSSGILLHPTSLPGRYGIGDLGDWAYKFVDWLEAAGQTLWQVLPLGPTSYGDSPYQALSAFAGNTNLISLDRLVEAGWLTEDDLADVPEFPVYLIDYGWVIDYHNKLLTLAYERFLAQGTQAQRAAFRDWCASNAGWLEDYALFATFKALYGGKPWVEWPEGAALRHPQTIEAARQNQARQIDEQRFRQWLFFTQWLALKAYANEKQVRLIGDIPIFVAHDSSDVWVNRDLFYLDEKGNPTVIAGVPPDYFSPTGQRWGNPLYRWNVIHDSGYGWWIARIKATLALVDYVRIDHFRGFAEYWEVPASEETAMKGRWVKGPRLAFFEAIKAALGELPIIAEDLGLIFKSVVELRDTLGLPGMKILQFAFGDQCGANAFLPHHYPQNCVVYTGTHDNNTTVGWWNSETSPEIRQCLAEYIGCSVQQPNWELIRLALRSVAHTAIIPMQDVLGYGADTRMNTPGAQSGNWGWRFSADALEHPAQKTLAYLTKLYSRWPESADDEAEAAEEPEVEDA